MSTLSITAVVVTHNRPTELIQVIAALQNQTYPPSRILVLDNASPIPAAQTLADFSGIDIVRSATNTGGAGGFALAMQTAMKDAKCDWIWLMDDDAIPRANALEALVASQTALQRATPAKPIGALCSTVFEFNAIAPTHRRTFSGTTGLERKLPLSVYTKGSTVEIDTGSFVGFMVNAAAVKSVGLPNAAFFLAYDDTEYSLRLQKAGWHVYLAVDSEIDHLRGAESRLRSSNFGAKHYYNIRNRLVVVRQYAQHKAIASAIACLLGLAIWALSRSSFSPSAVRTLSQALCDGFAARLGPFMPNTHHS